MQVYGLLIMYVNEYLLPFCLQGAIALFDMIEYYESCTKLNLSFNKNIGIRGWQSCARMLKKVCISAVNVWIVSDQYERSQMVLSLHFRHDLISFIYKAYIKQTLHFARQ